MTLHLLPLDEVAPEPWRNGGGLTRPLLTWPSGTDWLLRVSVADIGRDGPFSAFGGCWRAFAVLEGAGVRLRFGEQWQALDTGTPPLVFDGALAPECRLVDGPTRDLNLVLAQSAGQPCIAWAPTRSLQPGARWRAVYSHGPALLLRPGAEAVVLAGPTLAWSDDDPLPWQLAGARAPAYWLALDPPDGAPA